MTYRRILLLATFWTWQTIAASSAHAQSAELNGSMLVIGDEFLASFQEIVVGSRDSTVRVLSAGEQLALGTIVSGDGLVVTKASQLRGPMVCRLSDGRVLECEYVARHDKHDLALLKLPLENLPSVRWSTSEPAVGQWLATPGHGKRPVAVGIVSVTEREIPYEPISGVLGVRLADTGGPPQIAQVFENSAAEKAQLAAGDIIKQIGESVVGSREEFVRNVQSHEPGEKVELRILRGEIEMIISATLTHPFGDFLSRIAEQNLLGGALSNRRTGFPAVIQHDTVLSPEQCGGPVVDLDGHAIGINIARAGRTESYALPAAVVQKAVEEMRAGDYPPPEWTGISFGEPPPPPEAVRLAE